MMELILNGLGPKALIFERREEIITLGVMVAEELFDKTAPVVTLTPEDFRQVLGWDGKIVHVRGDQVSDTVLEWNAGNGVGGLSQSRVQLTDADRAMLDGANGEAARISLKIIIRMADMMDAKELMDVSQAHADGAWYGPGSVAFGRRLRDWGGRFQVPTTINSLNVDQKRWRALGSVPTLVLRAMTWPRHLSIWVGRFRSLVPRICLRQHRSWVIRLPGESPMR